MEQIMNFFVVLVVAVGVASGIGILYATGLRMWALGGVDTDGIPQLAPRIASVLCFTCCVAIVLFTLWIMIPVFH